MPQPDPSPRRSARRRGTGATHPAPARPGGRRGGDRRPWPTASTTTHISPGKPARPTVGTSRSHSPGAASTPTPATVWPAGAAPIDLDAIWPPALIRRAVLSFSAPGERVVLLDWPTPGGTNPALGMVGADGVVHHAPGAEADPELADAAALVARLDRVAHIERISLEAAPAPVSRPFWADLITGGGPAPTTIPSAVAPAVPPPVVDPADRADVLITSLPPHRHDEHQPSGAADGVALYAARRLRAGGILIVLTHCDWSSGELSDPTGPVVTAGQNADLLYLQHIVALHTPVRDGRFHHPDTASPTDDEGRARHRALVRGLPAPHRRIHSDITVFAQPHEHHPAPPGDPR